MEYTNPRMEATIENWPFGRNLRAIAHFSIEHTPRGERGVRVITDPITKQQYAPKKLTFAKKARIVDGTDGRTYIIELSGYGHISIMRGDMKYQHDVVYDNDPRYQPMLALFGAPTRGESAALSGADTGFVFIQKETLGWTRENVPADATGIPAMRVPQTGEVFVAAFHPQADALIKEQYPEISSRQLEGGYVYQGKFYLSRHAMESNLGQFLHLFDSPSHAILESSCVRLYRGVSSVSPSHGKFYHEDPEFARQFTQSGRDHEILVLDVPLNAIYQSDPLPYGGDPDELDAAEVKAKAAGYGALYASEGSAGKPSVYIFNRALFRGVSRLG